MANYELRFRKSVLKDLRSIPSKDVSMLLRAIERLSTDPRPPQSQKLTAREQYRLRNGQYRILYEIEDARVVIVVVRIAHRKDV
ncbi:type II toxin-antitoxin system mRNA interferase toxin, RelE/StbE family [bacterium]|nr:type II toxin-antitoxin system mRNA interferase toxin, RelE/StbE family [bacterium]